MSSIHKSKKLALILRHDPSVANTTVDELGWAPIRDILSSLSLSLGELIEIIQEDDKGRYEYDAKKKRIRALQGHSLAHVSIERTIDETSEFLYHGTPAKNVQSIQNNGLTKMGRNYVHLTINKETAIETAFRRRRKNNAIFIIDSVKMRKDGNSIYISKNNVYLTDYIHPKYLKNIEYIENPDVKD